MKTEDIAGIWLILSVIVGGIGLTKKIGFWGGFACAALLSPLIGIIIVLVSGNPKQRVHKYKGYVETAKRELYKGNVEIAIDNYKNALFHLETDYTDLIKGSDDDKQRLENIVSIKNKVEELQTNVITR